MIIEIRWHGRGGQGAVTASELVAVAAIKEGKYALAFPEFGAERRGAPVRAYTRITAETTLIPRTPVLEPDIVVVLDSGLLGLPDVLQGIKKGGLLLVNTKAKPSELRARLGCSSDIRVATVDATGIALETIRAPIVNTAILGALVRASNVVSLENIIEAVKERFPGRVGEVNVEAVKKAYEKVEVG